MPKIIILAAGYSSRLSVNKLLVKIKDEPVLARQIRMVRNLTMSTPIVVVRKDDQELQNLIGNNGRIVFTETDHKDSFNELKATMHLWDSDTLILLGDLVYSSKALKFMLDATPGPMTVFGLMGNTKWCDKSYLGHLHWGEVFAVKIQRKYISEAISSIRDLPNKHYDLWNIPFGLNIPITQVDECTDIDYNKDIKPIQALYGELS